MKEPWNKLICLTIFSVAMGFLEAVVVVYLRQLYYPEGFSFPLKPIALEGLSLEYLREISTIVMLVTVGGVAGRNFHERVAFVLYSFGLWDIFYYVWLKVLLNWPPSLLTLDILFLLPVVWVGPVLAPIICFLTMAAIAGCILYFHRTGYPLRMHSPELALLTAGTIIIFATFVWDYSRIIIQGGFLPQLFSLGKDPLFQKMSANYLPTSYHWSLFLFGEFLVILSFLMFFKRIRSAGRN